MAFMSMHFAKALCLDKGICTEACVNNVYSMFVMKQYVGGKSAQVCPTGHQ